MARIMKLSCKLWKRGRVTGTIHDVREVLSRFSVRTCLVPSTAEAPETHSCLETDHVCFLPSLECII